MPLYAFLSWQHPTVDAYFGKALVCFFAGGQFSAGPFVISLFLFVKIDLATDSGSEYDRDKKKIGFHFFLHM